MQKIKLSIFTVYNRIIAYLLGLMGFAAGCIPEPVEYGMPHATFKLKGTVQSNATELYIPNIRVCMGYDSTVTDAEGNFEISQIEFPESQTFIVKFKDVDEATNGRFIDIDTTIKFEDPQFINGDGDWYHGETEKTISIKLDPEE